MDDSTEINVLAVPANANILTIKSFASKLLDMCQTQQHLRLDASDVAQADLSFVQAVQSAQNFMRDKGGMLQLSQPANAILAELLASAGFAPDAADTEFWFHGATAQ